MSADEFDHWLEFMRVEVIGAGSEVERWAYVMAALHNGPMVRKSKARFTAGDFMPRRWQPAEKTKPASGADARAFVKSLRKKVGR